MNEDTRTNEASIMEVLRDVKPKELGFAQEDIPTIDKEQEKPNMTVTSAGHVFVWDTRTFEKIPVLYYMLPAKLRERRVDGSYRFTVTEPKEKPRRGTIKCLLHPDDENRDHYKELGFRTCNKENITNNWQRTRHMQLKHSKEWAAIESEVKESKDKEQRDLQMAILGRLAGDAVKTEERELYVSDKDKKKVPK